MNIAQLSVGVGPYYIVSVTRGSPNPLFHRLPERLSRARKGSQADAPRTGTEGWRNQWRNLVHRRRPTHADGSNSGANRGSSWGTCSVAGLWHWGKRRPTAPDSTTVRMAIRLVTARTECAISRAELGRRAGLSPRAIAKVEAGGQSGVDIVEALARRWACRPHGWPTARSPRSCHRSAAAGPPRSHPPTPPTDSSPTSNARAPTRGATACHPAAATPPPPTESQSRAVRFPPRKLSARRSAAFLVAAWSFFYQLRHCAGCQIPPRSGSASLCADAGRSGSGSAQARRAFRSRRRCVGIMAQRDALSRETCRGRTACLPLR